MFSNRCFLKNLLEPLFNNFSGLKAWNLKRDSGVKKRLRHRYFPVNFAQFFKKPYLQNTSGWLLLLIPPFQPKFHLLITLFLFFPSFFPLLLIIAIMGVCSENVKKKKIFLTFYSRLFKNTDNVASAIIDPRTEKI